MHVFCHDCEHWFTEPIADTESDAMVCPYCEGGNFDAYAEEE